MNNILKSICLVIITICLMSIAYDLNQTIPDRIYKVYKEIAKIGIDIDVIRRK